MISGIRSLNCFLAIVFALASCGVSQPASSAAKPVVTLPFVANDHGIIFLKARVQSSQWMSFALDSGASFAFAVDSRRARELKLKLNNSQTFAAGGGPGSCEVADADGVTIGLRDLRCAGRQAKLLALDSLESIAGRRLDGLVGQYLFRNYVVEINYADKTVKLYDPQTFAYKGSGELLPLTVEEHYFFVSARVGMPGQGETVH